MYLISPFLILFELCALQTQAYGSRYNHSDVRNGLNSFASPVKRNPPRSRVYAESVGSSDSFSDIEARKLYMHDVATETTEAMEVIGVDGCTALFLFGTTRQSVAYVTGAHIVESENDRLDIRRAVAEAILTGFISKISISSPAIPEDLMSKQYGLAVSHHVAEEILVVNGQQENVLMNPTRELQITIQYYSNAEAIQGMEYEFFPDLPSSTVQGLKVDYNTGTISSTIFDTTSLPFSLPLLQGPPTQGPPT